MNERRNVRAAVAVAIVTVAVTALAGARPAGYADGIAVYFSPGGGCTEAVVAEIAGARASLNVQARRFTSGAIADAIGAAARRGVAVKVVLDPSQRTDAASVAPALRDQGIAVLIDDEHAAAGSNVMVIDDRTIVTGSFGFSGDDEERRAENLLVITGKGALVQAYADNFRAHLGHARPFDQQSPEPPAGESQEPVLAVLSWDWEVDGNDARIAGEALNVGDAPLSRVVVVANLYDAEGRFVASDHARLEFDPLAPGRRSPFEVRVRWKEGMAAAELAFREVSGRRIPWEDRDAGPADR